jgi:hypothetical protein
MSDDHTSDDPTSDGHEYSVEAARAAADRDELNAWVAQFLASPGSDNAVLGEELTEPPRTWVGPMRLPIDRLHRLAGPSGDPVLVPVDDDYWRDDIDGMAARIEQGWEPPPVIVTFRDDQLALEDGNHRVEGLRRAGRDEAWALVSFETDRDRERFELETTSG